MPGSLVTGGFEASDTVRICSAAHRYFFWFRQLCAAIRLKAGAQLPLLLTLRRWP